MFTCYYFAVSECKFKKLFSNIQKVFDLNHNSSQMKNIREYFSIVAKLFGEAAVGTLGLDLGKEVVAFVINEDECREVFYFDFPDCLHAQFGVFE